MGGDTGNTHEERGRMRRRERKPTQGRCVM
jgi:hypothetical protein